MADERPGRIAKIELDQQSLAAADADAEHERRVAIFDLLEENAFSIDDDAAGPYHIYLSTAENRLIIDARNTDDDPVKTIILSMSPFRGVVRDYFKVCGEYYEAIRTLPPDRIEAVDMARRSVHNEGSEMLQERLKGKAEVDFDTARRLFTLICALHRPR